MKKGSLYLLIFLMLSSICQAQHHYSKKRANDFTKLSIGPDLGAMAYFAYLRTNEAKLYGELSVGGTIDIRPVRFVGLSTSFQYNKLINGTHYYSSPVLLYFYNKENKGPVLGPVFYFNANEEKVSFSNPSIGGAIGYHNSSAGVYLIYNPKHPLFQDNLKDIQFFIGIGIRMSLRLIIV